MEIERNIYLIILIFDESLPHETWNFMATLYEIETLW
jgi:hypothetical protein